MKVKLLVVALLAVALMVGFGITQAFADGCCMEKKGGDFKDKVHDKAMIMLSKQDELGLSDDQVKQIKDLKHKVMKDMIRKDAEIDVLAIDIKSAMWEDSIDTEAVDKLLDAKYDLKKAEAKAIVAALADLQNILTKEQQDKMKAIVKECKKAMMACPMMKGGCPMMKGMKSEGAKSEGMKPMPEMSHKK